MWQSLFVRNTIRNTEKNKKQKKTPCLLVNFQFQLCSVFCFPCSHLLVYSPHYGALQSSSIFFNRHWNKVGNWPVCMRLCVWPKERQLLAVSTASALFFSLCADVIRWEKECFVFPEDQQLPGKFGYLEWTKSSVCMCECTCVLKGFKLTTPCFVLLCPSTFPVWFIISTSSFLCLHSLILCV